MRSGATSRSINTGFDLIPQTNLRGHFAETTRNVGDDRQIGLEKIPKNLRSGAPDLVDRCAFYPVGERNVYVHPQREVLATGRSVGLGEGEALFDGIRAAVIEQNNVEHVQISVTPH